MLDPDGHVRDQNHTRHTRVIPYNVAQSAKSILASVITSGTGKEAQIPEFAAGKTGTTENYGDAWFVGFNKDLTVAVWVGYPDTLRPMLHEFHGGPVAGGTFPAEIWHDFMMSWITLRDGRKAAHDLKNGVTDTTTSPTPTVTQTTPVTTQSAPAQTPTTPAKTPATKQPTQKTPTPAPTQQAPAQQPQPTQQPTTTGGGGGTTPPPSGTVTPQAQGTG